MITDERLDELAEIYEGKRGRPDRVWSAGIWPQTAAALRELQTMRSAIFWLFRQTALHVDPDGNWSELDSPGDVRVPAEIESVIRDAWSASRQSTPAG